MSRTVVLVGHCLPDKFMLKSAVKRIVPGAEIESVNDRRKLEPYESSSSVFLVNRELDGRFETPGGIDLIRELAGLDDGPTLILISNFPEAQEEAVTAGARPGFGKSDLYDDRTAEILRDTIG